MIRLLATLFAALFGLAFGSFLNVCLSRWPEGESVVQPRSHCRVCGHVLPWYENIPVLSWLFLHARCSSCTKRISARYPLVELAVGVLWAISAWQGAGSYQWLQISPLETALAILAIFATMGFFWLLVALAMLDFDHLWLPDWLTLPGIVAGFAVSLLDANRTSVQVEMGVGRFSALLTALLNVLLPAAILLLIRTVYWFLRRREGIGLGDIKLMAMMGAWLGVLGAMLTLTLGVLLGAAIAVAQLMRMRARHTEGNWALGKLPLGTFLCVGGIVTGLWGREIIGAYLRLFAF